MAANGEQRRGAAGYVRIKHGTTTPNVVDMVELYGIYNRVEVLNVDGAGRLYFRADGDDPAIGGDDCEVIPGAGALEVTVPRSRTARPYTIKLISDVAVAYSVRGLY